MWSIERVELLKKLWARDLPAGQIAVELGLKSRGAVLGKVHRLGLSGRLSGRRAVAAPSPHQARSTGMRSRGRKTSAAGRPIRIANEPVEAVAPVLVEIPMEQRKTLLQLTEHTCRWPVGDPGRSDFYFCGGEAAEGRPYCSVHCRVAFVMPARPQRVRRPLNDGGAA